MPTAAGRGISKDMTTTYLSLGSNVGQHAENIATAIAALNERGVRVLRESSLYETEPVGLREQPWFLNCVVEAETTLAPERLIDAVLDIEKQMGRQRSIPGGPRLIDIDILFYGGEVVRAPSLEIPHPRLADRRFVLVPLHEIAPSLRHPMSKKTVAELLSETPDRSEVRLWRPSPG